MLTQNHQLPCRKTTHHDDIALQFEQFSATELLSDVVMSRGFNNDLSADIVSGAPHAADATKMARLHVQGTKFAQTVSCKERQVYGWIETDHYAITFVAVESTSLSLLVSEAESFLGNNATRTSTIYSIIRRARKSN